MKIYAFIRDPETGVIFAHFTQTGSAIAALYGSRRAAITSAPATGSPAIWLDGISAKRKPPLISPSAAAAHIALTMKASREEGTP